MKTQLLFLFVRAVVALLLNLGVGRRRVDKGLDEAAGKGVGEDDSELGLASDGGVDAVKELLPLGPIIRGE